MQGMFFSDFRLEKSMGVRKERQGGQGPLAFEIFNKKGCFLSFKWEKSNFTTFGPPWKNLGKIPCWPPLEKILPTPMDKRPPPTPSLANVLENEIGAKQR